MKISNSKKQLARIISDNGGWPDGAEWAVQGRETMLVGFSKTVPYRRGCGWFIKGETPVATFKAEHVIANWHQTVLARDEYFHLYPAQDADGWIEWKGGECPVDDNPTLDVKCRGGELLTGFSACRFAWFHDDGVDDIIAYRLHKPESEVETPKPERVVIEQQPSIEQLAAEYRNRKDYAERKQQEANEAEAEAEAKLAELVAAGNAAGLTVGLAVSVPAAEPELVITDWRDLQVGDEVEYLEGTRSDYVGVRGVVASIDRSRQCGDYRINVKFHNGTTRWCSEWRFVRRPAKGATDA